MFSSDTQRRLIDLLKQLGVAALYALLIHLDHRHFESGTTVSTFEAASGFALAVLLLGGKRYAWGVFLGAFLSSATTGITLMPAVAIATGNTLGALICTWLLTHGGKFDKALQSLRSYLLLILAGSIGSIGGALNGTTALLISGFMTSETYLTNLAHWWMGDVLGIALITPLILVCWHTKNDWRGAKRVAEAALLLGLTFLAGQVVFLDWFHDSLGQVAKGYWMFMLITWVAVRLGARGAVIVLIVTAVQALWGAHHGTGYFADDIAQTQLANYWLYMVILSVVGMALVTFLAERKTVEKILRFHSEILLNLSEGVYLVRASDGKIVFTSPQFECMFGYEPGELLGKHVSIVNASDEKNPEAVAAAIISELTRTGVWKGELQNIRKDGTTFWCHANVSTFEHPEFGHVWVSAHEDITERKQAEVLVQQFGSLLQGSFNEIYMFYADSLHFILASEGAEKNLGYSTNELYQLTPLDIKPLFTRESFERLIAPLRSGEQPALLFETVHRRKDGTTYPAEVRLQFMPGDSPVFLAILQDVTERKSAEQQLRNHSAHILSVREEEKARIAREIHDDLGGTLTALKMDAYWLSRKLPANEETAPLRERIASMAQLIDDAVGVTRRVITDLRPTMLDDLGLLAALEWQAAQFHKRTGIECRVNCIEDEAGLDKQCSIALFRIFQEALTNVARHSGASRVEVEFRHSDEEVFLSISDNGRGMPKQRTDASITYMPLNHSQFFLPNIL